MAFLVTPATLKSDVYPKHLQEAFGIKKIQKSSVINYEQSRWRTVKGTKVMSAFSSVNFYLPHKQRVFVYQIAPGNWVEMIEYQAHQDIKKDIIRRDLELLTSSLSKDIPFHIVAHFCTHFPVFDKDIKEVLLGQKRIHADAEIIKQGEIFAQEFVSLMKSQKKISEKSPNVSQLSEPKIFITGQNKEETENLVKTIFPDQKTISVETIK